MVKNPKDNFNACDDFFQLILQCHIVAAALKVFGMDSCTSLPPVELQPKHISKCSLEEKKRILKKFSRAIVQAFTNLQLSMDSSHVLLIYDDQICGYAIELMTLGLLYVEFTDAIREADGKRILNCWKFMFPLFRASGRTNYTIETFRMLYSYYYLLSPRHGQQLLWSRCVNTTGRQGKNVAMDIHMEHLNRACKEAISGLGANKTPKAITRIGKCVGVLTSVVQNYDAQTEVKKVSTGHGVLQDQKDCDIVIRELLSHSIFNPIPGRCHRLFRCIESSLFSRFNYEQLIDWMKNHIPS